MSLTLGPIFNTQNNKIREWIITISLFDKHDRSITITDAETMAVKEGYYATYFTQSGYINMKTTVSDNTIVSIGKNIGKKNETNVLSQAYKESLSKYSSKIKAGYTEEKNDMSSNVLHTLPFPMAVKPWKDHKQKLTYPLFIQPKLDGIRMLAKYDNGKVQLYTRRLHDICGFTKIKTELENKFKLSKYKSFILDGELYSHGVNLQTISGIVRNESIEESVKETLQFYVFDCFNPFEPNLPFDKRFNILQTFFDKTPSMMVLNETKKINSSEVADVYYNKLVVDGYEGVIYKSDNRPYEFDFNKEKRSSWYLKRKKQEDMEYPIVGFTQGKGKNLGCVVFILQAKNGKTFNCVPNGTYDYLKSLYTKAVESFDTSFNNVLAKVVFDDLSKDNIPLRGRIVQIGRDYNFD